MAVGALPFVLRTPKPSAVIKDVGDSNAVLRFYGWVDQTKTDFLKGRSLAIQAAKTALEQEGFGLPEPIYRLRFDDAAPLPVKRLPQKTARAASEAVAPSPPSGADLDLGPDRHVETLVNEERASGDRHDLLSNTRPVE